MATSVIDPQPWWTKKTYWAAAAAFVLELAPLFTDIEKLLPAPHREAFHSAALIAVAVAVILARRGAVQAAERAMVVADPSTPVHAGSSEAEVDIAVEEMKQASASS